MDVNFPKTGQVVELRLPGSAAGKGESTAGKTAVAEQSRVAEPQSLQELADTLESHIQSIGRNLNFRLDDSTGKVVVQVTDSESGEVIRQMPSEEALRLAEHLDELRSLMFRAEA